MPRDFPPEQGGKVDALDWFIVITGIGVLIVTILWFANVLPSQFIFRLSVACYCFILGVVFLLKRFLPGLARKYPPKSLLFYLIAGIGAFLVGLFILILTFVVS